MILDDVLERGLTDAADDYDIPSGALERVRQQLDPSVTEPPKGGVRRQSRLGWRPSGNAWMGMVAAAVIVLIAVPIAIGGSGSSGREDSAGSTAVSPARKTAPQALPEAAGGSVGGSAATAGGGSTGSSRFDA